MTPHRLLVLVVTLAVTGCATTSKPPPIYYWGSYEEQIYSAHASASTLTVHDQIVALEADRASAGTRRLPPGFHAQLGYLYSIDGQTDAAKAEFLAEKTAFPESAAFMDRLLATMQAAKDAPK